MAMRGMHGNGRGFAAKGGMYGGGVAEGNVCGKGGVRAGETATEEGGTHPTGMQSC